MSRCPNCSYILVLLEKRAKYKCAKCGKLFAQKEIDDEEFKEWNKGEREKDRKEFDRQQLLLRKTLKPKKQVNPAEKQKKLQEYRLAYYERNKAKILAYKKEWRRVAKERNNATRKVYRDGHKELMAIVSRIDYWRQMQKALLLKWISKNSTEFIMSLD